MRFPNASSVGRRVLSSSSVSMYRGQFAQVSRLSVAERSTPARSPGPTYAAGTPHPASAPSAAPPPRARSRDRREGGEVFRFTGTREACRPWLGRDNGRCVDQSPMRPDTLSIRFPGFRELRARDGRPSPAQRLARPRRGRCARRERDPHGQAAARTGPCLDRAAVGGGDGRDDGQAEPEAIAGAALPARVRPGPFRAQPPERLEESGHLVVRDHRAGVVDPQDRAPRLRPGPQLDPALLVPTGVVPYGVVGEVDHQAFDQLGVAQHGRGAEVGPHPRPAGPGPAVRQQLPHRLGEVDELLH